jgi:A/G-specific adenine glycosylase
VLPKLFQDLLKEWHLQLDRPLPWVNEKDPYKIWISEIILQQTRVVQGLPYYVRFIDTFPNVIALANAPEIEVIKCWEGLGYYSRARNLHWSAKYIVNELNGVFPKQYDEIITPMVKSPTGIHIYFKYNISIIRLKTNYDIKIELKNINN